MEDRGDMSMYPEGETPADVCLLHKANGNLAMEAHMLAKVLADLLRQVREFVEENGEANFYTGHAAAALHKYNPLDYKPPATVQGMERMRAFVGLTGTHRQR